MKNDTPRHQKKDFLYDFKKEIQALFNNLALY